LVAGEEPDREDGERGGMEEGGLVERTLERSH
jgi:hypothetical protein